MLSIARTTQLSLKDSGKTGMDGMLIIASMQELIYMIPEHHVQHGAVCKDGVRFRIQTQVKVLFEFTLV